MASSSGMERHDTGSIVEDVRGLRADVARVLHLLEGNALAPGLVEEVRSAASQVEALMDRERERETRRTERLSTGVMALLASLLLAVGYHMTIVYEVSHVLGIHGWSAVLMSTLAYLLVTWLLVFGLLAVMR